MKRTLIWLFAGTLLSANLCAEDYPIRFSRPFGAGSACRATRTVTDTQDISFTQGGHVLKQQTKEFRLDYQGLERVLESGKTGTSYSVIIEKLTRQEGGQVGEVLPKGSIIAVTSSGGNPSFKQNGQPVSPDLAVILHRIMPAKIGGADDEKTFGTPERKKIGDTWRVDDSRDENMKRAGLTGNGMQGTVLLKELEHTAAGDNLLLEIRTESKALFPAGKDFIPDSGSVRLSMAMKLPVNLNSLAPWAKSTIEANATAHKDGGANGPITFSMKGMQSDEQTVVVVKN